MNIGQVIKELRLERGLSQIELAIHCDLPLTTFSQIELGTRQPSEDTIRKLSEFFKIPEMAIYFLTNEEKDIPKTKKEVYNIISPLIRKAIRDIFRIQDQLNNQL